MTTPAVSAIDRGRAEPLGVLVGLIVYSLMHFPAVGLLMIVVLFWVLRWMTRFVRAVYRAWVPAPTLAPEQSRPNRSFDSSADYKADCTDALYHRTHGADR